MFGPNYGGLEIMGHEFNSKKMERFPLAGGGVRFSGQLSHRLDGFRPDDQVYFEFTIKDGTIQGKIQTKINEGGLGDFVGIAASAIAAYYGVPLSPKLAAELWSTVAKNVEGKGWQEVAGLIIGAVAAQCAAVDALPAGTTIRQASTGKYLDAYHDTMLPHMDFRVVLRDRQDNNTQRWALLPTGAANTFTIVEKSSGRYLDAFQTNDNDYGLVTRLAQDNNSQKWVLTPLPNGRYTFRQLSSGRYMDAYETGDFQVVTRGSQDNDTQKWSAVLPGQ
jgi:hypothetical protein